jgi:hypothetical protein
MENNGKSLKTRLIEALEQFPPSWTLTTLDGNKRPYRPSWQDESPLLRDYLKAAIETGEKITYSNSDGSSIRQTSSWLSSDDKS